MLLKSIVFHLKHKKKFVGNEENASYHINSLTNDRILGLFNTKAFEDDKWNVTPKYFLSLKG